MINFPNILQLDISGRPMKWITFETSAYHYSKGNVVWSMGTDEIILHGGISSITGKQSLLKINTIIAVRGEQKKKTKDQYNKVPLTNKTLFRRDLHICGYCGNVFSFNNLTRDHILPSCHGGRNTWENLITCCAPCNKHKAGYLLENTNMKLLYLPYAPNRAEWLILQNRNILVDQMECLMKNIPKTSRLFNI